MPDSALIGALARSLMAGDATIDLAYARAVRTLGRPWPFLESLTARYIAAFADRSRPRRRDVVGFLLQDAGFRRARARHGRHLVVAQWLADAPRMQPVDAALAWDLPGLTTPGDLGRWLSVQSTELDWFADLKALATHPRLHHYRYRVTVKRSGGVRLLESPKPELKALQRRILAEILDRVPPHPAAHGFVRGRSVVTFAAPHAGRRVVLRLDLDNFFPAFPGARVQAVFRTLGYPEPVADRLGGICSNAAPAWLWKERPLEFDPRSWREARTLYTRPHLPQGAPTSPALANITAYHLDCRLAGLARTAGAVYTRYADDLAFSGDADFARVVDRFAAHAAAIALDEGFAVNHHKTRILRPGTRQSLAGIVVNSHPAVRRADRERLEAILTNCVRYGPASQNRERVPDFRAHLQGRIGYVEMANRAHGERLRHIFRAIPF